MSNNIFPERVDRKVIYESDWISLYAGVVFQYWSYYMQKIFIFKRIVNEENKDLSTKVLDIN